jgi:hypothetical protein
VYFKNFPRIIYQVSPPGYKRPAEYVKLVDITTNIRFKKEVLDNITLYDYYHIQDGDTPEIISEKLYGSPHYNWIIMLLNDIYDYRKDFIMSTEVFDRYITEKYGSVETAMRTIVGYKDSNGNGTTAPSLYNSNDGDLTTLELELSADAYPIYAYDYELSMNESRRQIKVLSKQLLTLVLRNFKDIV